MEGIAGLEVVPSNELASTLGQNVSNTRLVNARAVRGQSTARELQKKAAEAYFDGRAAKALEYIQQIETASPLAKSWWPVSEQIHLRLWRTAIFLELKDREQARSEARAALTLRPALEVDLGEFPPQVAKLVESERSAGLRNVTVVVRDQPDDAKIFVDGRPVGARFRVPAGRHQLKVTAARYIPYETWFDAPADRAVPVHMPLALQSEYRESIRTVLAQGALQPKDHEGMRAVVSQAGTDVLVLCSVRSGHRRREIKVVAVGFNGDELVSVGERWSTDNEESVDGLTRWVEQALTPVVAGRSLTGVDPNAGNGGPHGSEGEPVIGAGDFELEAAAALGNFWWLRVLSDESGERYRHQVSGLGTRIGLGVRFRFLVVGADLRFTGYRGPLDVYDASGTLLGNTEPGANLATRLHLGVVHGKPDSWSVRGGLLAHLARHDANDVIANSQPLGVFTNTSTVQAGLWAEGRLPHRLGRGLLEWRLSLAALPASGWTDDPATFGTNAGATAAMIAASATYRARRWRYRLGYELHAMRRDYEGANSIALTPAVTNPSVLDRNIGIDFMVGYSF